MLLPSPHKKSDQLQASPQLETPEQISLSVERDQALRVQAQRERDEIAVERDRFELDRDKVVFGFELIGAVLALIVLAALSVFNPELLPITLLSGGSLGGVGILLRKRFN